MNNIKFNFNWKFLILLIILSLFLFQTSLAVIPSRNVFIEPILIPNNPSNIISDNHSNDSKIVYLDPENTSEDQTPLNGEIIQLDDFDGYYVMLGEEQATTDLKVKFGTFNQEKIVLDKSIIANQELTITNNGNETLNKLINLWDFSDTETVAYLKEAESLEIVDENNLLMSEKPSLNINLSSGQTKKYIINYVFRPLDKKIICEEKSIIDLIPKNAIISKKDLPLDTVISKTCYVSINYAGSLNFKNVEFTLNELSEELSDGERISKITNIETGEILKIQNGIIII